MKRFLAAFALCSLAATAQAPTKTTITASLIQDFQGNPLSSGKITFTPGDNFGNPIAARGAFFRSASCYVLAGAITTATTGGTCQVVDALASNPNVCYRVTLFDSVLGQTIPTPGQICAQPTGTTWSYDNYVPNMAPATLVQAGPIGQTGPAPTMVGGTAIQLASNASPTVTVTPAGAGTYAVNVGVPAGLPPAFKGPWSSSTGYVIADVVSFGGQSYAALTANTNVTPVAGATWALVAASGDATAGSSSPGDVLVNVGGVVAGLNPISSGSPIQTPLSNRSGFLPRTYNILGTSGYSALHCGGDSITCGIGTSGSPAGCSVSTSYCGQLDTLIGSPTMNDYGVASTLTAEIAWTIFNTENRTSGDNEVLAFSSGMNDLLAAAFGTPNGGSFALVTRRQLSNIRLGAITWGSTVSANKLGASSFGTLPTNWNNDTTLASWTGINTTVSGADAPWVISSAVPGWIFVWFWVANSNSHSAYLTIGSTKYPLFTDVATSGPSDHGGYYRVAALSNNTTGSVTIHTVATLGGSDKAIVLGVGQNPGNSTDGLMYVPGLTYPQSGSYEPASSQLYQDQMDDVVTAQGWGLNVYFTPTRNNMLGSTAELWQSAPIVHPTFLGAGEIAKAIAGKNVPLIQPVAKAADPSSFGDGTAITSCSSGSVYLPETTQQMEFSVSAACTALLPLVSISSSSSLGLKWMLLSNTGTGSITLSGVSITGGNANNYVMMTGDFCFASNINGQTTWNVICQPNPSRWAYTNTSVPYTLRVTQPLAFLTGTGVVTYPAASGQAGTVILVANYGTGVMTFTGSSIAASNNLVLYPNDFAVIADSNTTNGWYVAGHTNVAPNGSIGAPSIGGVVTGTYALALGAGAGTTPGTPVCITNHVCDSIHALFSFTTGSTPPTTGVLATVTTGITRAKIPDCSLKVWLTASPFTPIEVAPSNTTTAVVFNLTGTALTASTSYTAQYTGCAGN